MIPQARLGLGFGGEARECIYERAVFGRFIVEKLTDPADGPKWEGNNIENEDKWKCNDPPECLEEISHVVLCCRCRWGMEGEHPSVSMGSGLSLVQWKGC